MKPHEGPIRTVARVVAAATEVGITELLGPRHSTAAERQIAMSLACELVPDASLTMVGRVFRRDHTTVIHARRRIADRVAHDDAFRDKVEKLRLLCQGELTKNRPGLAPLIALRAEADDLASAIGRVYTERLRHFARRDPEGFLNWVTMPEREVTE